MGPRKLFSLTCYQTQCLSLFELLWQIAIAWMAYKQQKFLTVLETGESKIKAAANPMCGETLLPSSLLTTSLGRGLRELSGASFMGTLMPSWKLLSYGLFTSQRPQLLTSSHGRLGFHPVNLVGNKNIQSATMALWFEVACPSRIHVAFYSCPAIPSFPVFDDMT